VEGQNLDRKPGFWLTVLMILPFMAMVEIALHVDELRKKLRR
jgi:hypothetical protein